MAQKSETIEEYASREYKYGFVSDIKNEQFPRGLNEEIIH